MKFRKGTYNDLNKLKELGINSWSEYKNVLSSDNWKELEKTLKDSNTYSELLKNSECIVCENNEEKIIGMAFLVPSGNSDEIYEKEWSRLRFVSASPNYKGKRIGELLTKKCIELAKINQESIIALHTSEIMNSAKYIYEKIGFKMFKEIKPRLGVRYWLYTYRIED